MGSVALSATNAIMNTLVEKVGREKMDTFKVIILQNWEDGPAASIAWSQANKLVSIFRLDMILAGFRGELVDLHTYGFFGSIRVGLLARLGCTNSQQRRNRAMDERTKQMPDERRKSKRESAAKARAKETIDAGDERRKKDREGAVKRRAKETTQEGDARRKKEESVWLKSELDLYVYVSTASTSFNKSSDGILCACPIFEMYLVTSGRPIPGHA